MKVNTEAVGSEEYCIRMMDLPCTVKAMVCYDEEGFPSIFVNARLGREEQEKAILHELRHIRQEDVYNDRGIEAVESREE